MKKYYLHNGAEQQGPFDIDDLKSRNINKDTPIWYEGILDWTTADKIDELKNLLKTATPPPFGTKQTPPPIKKPQTYQTTPTKKKSNVVRTILRIVIVLIVVIGGLAFLNNLKQNSGSYSTDPATYQEKIMTVEEIEKADPAKFLDASGNYNENFWGDAMKVHGTIKNNATVANYKDVLVEVIFYSGTDTELDRKQYQIFDYFPAHTTKAFELKIDKPSACKKLGWNAVSATPY